MIYNINCTKIDNKLSIPEISGITSNFTFFHCRSTGHFWKTTHITELSLLYEDKNNQQTVLQWTAENDSDEYEMLIAFSDVLSNFNTLIGFNSTSFHIPYLENKAKSYDLSSPFAGKQHIDLLKSIKPIGAHLHISTKLENLRIFLDLPDAYTEIECIAASTALFQYERLLNGDFDVESVVRIDDELLFTCYMDIVLPTPFRLSNEEFYLIAENKQMKIKTKLTDEKIKLYYPNHNDYFYLIAEDTVIHKSLAATIAKDKKRKALPEECFSYVAYTEQLGNNPAALKKYLCAMLKHYMDAG